MENDSIELSLLDSEERELVEYIYNAIPEQDRGNLTADDILFVLDLMDDFLEEQGLLHEDPQTGETVYLEGEVDETDAELQYGIEHGYYEE